MKVTKETFILLPKVYAKSTDEKHLKDKKMIKSTLSNTLYGWINRWWEITPHNAHCISRIVVLGIWATLYGWINRWWAITPYTTHCISRIIMLGIWTTPSTLTTLWKCEYKGLCMTWSNEVKCSNLWHFCNGQAPLEVLLQEVDNKECPLELMHPQPLWRHENKCVLSSHHGHTWSHRIMWNLDTFA